MYEAAALDLTDGEVLCDLATMLAEAGRMEEARRAFERAVNLAGSDIRVRMNFAAFLGQTGHTAEAEVNLRHLVRELRGAEARAKHRAQEQERRQARFRLGLAELNLARALMDQGRHPEARRLCEGWFLCTDHWAAAEELAAECVGAEGIDAVETALAYLRQETASPGMVALLVMHFWEDERSAPRALRALDAGLQCVPPGTLQRMKEVPTALAEIERSLRRRSLQNNDDLEAREWLALAVALRAHFSYPLR